jgi:hypothetical protein
MQLAWLSEKNSIYFPKQVIGDIWFSVRWMLNFAYYLGKIQATKGEADFLVKK